MSVMSGGIDEVAASNGTVDGEDSRITTNSCTGAEDVEVSRPLSWLRGDEDGGCDGIGCVICGLGLGTRSLGAATG
ncbi:hypothetical protein GBA52_008332 [Prunus armeniaca]|nr:hypothetical protein GBA52_008332 [Prunus armeniaca]